MVRSTDKVANAYQVALYASAVLAVDKGVPSEIKKTRKGYDVVTDKGDIFRFIQK